MCVQEERLRRGDDLRLQMALEESKKEGPDSGKLKRRKQVKREASDHEHSSKTASRLHHCIINEYWRSSPVFHCSV